MGNASSAPSASDGCRVRIGAAEEINESTETAKGVDDQVLKGAESYEGNASRRSSVSSSPAPTLRDTITLRERSRADPYRHYEALEVIGFGSMGSITRVRKRAASVGGSARRHNVDRCPGCLEGLGFGVGFVRKVLKVRRQCDVLGELPADCCPVGGADVSWGADGASSRGVYDSSVRRRNSRKGSRKGKRVLFDSLSSISGGASSGRKGEAAAAAQHEVQYAIKSIHLSRIRDAAFREELRNEVAILRSLDHPHIVRAIETFEHRRQLYVVMELCSGGDLYTRDPYTEEEAARICRMILSAVAFMHERNIVHRDLKYENIMFANQDPRSEIKLIDFGLSKKFGQDEYLSEGVGTIYTMAPQVLQGKYTSACDLWSIGVITYALLSSQVPFFANKRRKLVEKITKGMYNFKGHRWRVISQQAKDFVSSLLQVDPDLRPTALEARRSFWLNRKFAATERLSEEKVGNVQASIVNFSRYSKLQKLALMVVAHKSSSEEIGFLRKAFQKYSQVGVISRPEFRTCLVDFGYSNEELDEIFEAVDIDSTGYIKYTEFLAATIEVHGAINEERLAEAFDRLDSDDSGYISTNNLRSILGEEVPQADIDRIIEEADLTKDNRISYEEFLALWNVDQEQKREDAMQSVSIRNAKLSFDTISTLTDTTGT